MKKEATIRDNESEKCPFGLSISCACHNVGNLVNKMTPIPILKDTDIDENDIIKSNNFLFRWEHPKKKCIFANLFFGNNKDIVECSWNSDQYNTPQQVALVGSPYYYKHFNNPFDGNLSFPLGWFGESTIDKALYMGMFQSYE